MCLELSLFCVGRLVISFWIPMIVIAIYYLSRIYLVFSYNLLSILNIPDIFAINYIHYISAVLDILALLCMFDIFDIFVILVILNIMGNCSAQAMYIGTAMILLGPVKPSLVQLTPVPASYL